MMNRCRQSGVSKFTQQVADTQKSLKYFDDWSKYIDDGQR
jgi:hypothetical protein